jgi:hypothetical protein
MTPRIEQFPHGNYHQFVVRGRPFFPLAAELNNSSLSSSEYMDGVWARLKDQGFNTLLGSVTWEQIESTEGVFDFTELDRVVEDAKRHDMHLVLLWFGSFKNGTPAWLSERLALEICHLILIPFMLSIGQSTYIPPWVKIDDKRFPRVRINKDDSLQVREVLSIFSQTSIDADAKAFTALLSHLKEIDPPGGDETVIAVQVENEVGLLGDSRDRGELAEKAFKGAVPLELVKKLDEQWDLLNDEIKSNLAHFRTTLSTTTGPQRDNLSWGQLFGESPQTDEIFMAYHYALYLDQVASSGRSGSKNKIPLYTNAWLRNTSGAPGSNTTVSDGISPGEYPSGGPIETVLDIWQTFAPNLDFLAPDIYMPDYPSTCAAYKHRGQPLFIPEQRGDTFGAIRMWEAIGSYGALACSPFGIDTLPDGMNGMKRHLDLLKKVAPIILEARKEDRPMTGFFFDELPPVTQNEEKAKDPSPERKVTFGKWTLTISRAHVFGNSAAGYGLIIQLSPDRFLLIGEGFQISFAHTDPKATFSGILSFAEKDIEHDGKTELRTVRMLNGDETRSGTVAVMPSEAPEYGVVPVAILIPAVTRIAEVHAYALGL